eukprot:1888671-Rhodomonas_salina.1
MIRLAMVRMRDVYPSHGAGHDDQAKPRIAAHRRGRRTLTFSRMRASVLMGAATTRVAPARDSECVEESGSWAEGVREHAVRREPPGGDGPSKTRRTVSWNWRSSKAAEKPGEFESCRQRRAA